MSTSRSLRVLVVDAYPRDGRERLRACGGTEGGELYRRMLERIATDIEIEVEIDVVHPADGERLPAEPESYDGAAWTGSNLSILDVDDSRVTCQVDLARTLLGAGVASFGSCFAVQVAATALGGRCAANPKGREFGISRAIELSREGREHPLYRDKPAVFDAFTSHADEVVALPQGAGLLASNEWSRVQAASLNARETGPGACFWAVQYHPEYDLHEVASLCRLRSQELVAQGSFASEAEANAYIEDLETLHADPERADLAASHRIGESLLDETIRTLEVRNWIDHQVRPASTSNGSR
jgi:GMP synthase (glutamine-hydrolysing)